MAEIEEALLKGSAALSLILRRKQYRLEVDEKRKNILELLIKGEEQLICEKLDAIEKEETIYCRLERAFPGYFGQMLFSAYQPFLNEPLRKGGEEAYAEYIKYLDSLLPFELEYMCENTAALDFNDLREVNNSKIKAIENPKKWWRENKDIIEYYKQFKNSEEYLGIPIKRIQDKLKKYMQDNHYYEKAIPLIRKFSKSYNDYYIKLLAANTEYEKMQGYGADS